MTTPEDSSNMFADLDPLREQASAEPSNLGLQAKLFWSLHQHMKTCVEEKSYDRAASLVLEMASHQLPSEKGANATGWAVHKLLRVFREEPRLAQFDESTIEALVNAYVGVLPQAETPDKMHSAMLWISTQMQGEDGTCWYVPMVRAVGFERMQAEDFEGKEVNGYPLPSLAERVVMTAAKQAEHDPDQETVGWLIGLLDRLLQRKGQNIWLKYHRGRLLIAAGRGQEVRESMRTTVQSKRTEFWAWALLGEAFLSDAPEKTVPCLCKTITLKEDEVFLLGVRECLAAAFIRLGRYAEAKCEIEKILMTRKNKGYRVPSSVAVWTEAEWYAATSPAENAPLYIAEARSADELLFDALAVYVGIVTNIDEKSRSCFITFQLDGSARYRYHRSPWEKNLPEPGTYVTIRVREVETETGRRFDAVSMQPASTQPDPSFVREFGGDLKVISKPGKDPIGFVSDVFVPGALMRDAAYSSGMRLQGIAVKEKNRAKGEYGWRAVKIVVVPKESQPTAPLVSPPPPVTEPTAPAPQVEPDVAASSELPLDIVVPRRESLPSGDEKKEIDPHPPQEVAF